MEFEHFQSKMLSLLQIFFKIIIIILQAKQHATRQVRQDKFDYTPLRKNTSIPILANFCLNIYCEIEFFSAEFFSVSSIGSREIVRQSNADL